MNSNRVLQASLLALLTLCAAAAFVAFALNLLGYEKATVFLPDISQLRLIIIDVAILIPVAILSQFLTFCFAGLTKKIVFGFLDSRWLPKAGKAETHTTSQGERLETVFVQSVWATTFWDLASKTIPTTLVTSITVGILAMLITFFVADFPSLLVGALTVVLINSVFLPWLYWIKEWRRKHTKFVVFSFMTYYIKVRTPILALLIGTGTLPQSSKTPINQIQEVQISADPEDFDSNFKTSWIRDQYTSWLASKLNLRTIFLRSIFNRAEDILFWVEQGPGLANLLSSLVIKARDMIIEEEEITKTALEFRIGKPDDQTWNPSKGEAEANQYVARYRKVLTKPQTYDLYRVEDPGLYDNKGNPIVIPESKIQKRVVNVLQYFGGGKPSVPENLVEPEETKRDLLP